MEVRETLADSPKRHGDVDPTTALKCILPTTSMSLEVDSSPEPPETLISAL